MMKATNSQRQQTRFKWGPVMVAGLAVWLGTAGRIAALLIVFLPPSAGHAQTSNRSDGMRFIPDVPGQFYSLTEYPDALGFHISTTPDPSLCKHYQGVARVDGPDLTPFLLVTRSGAPLFNVGEVICNDSPGENGQGNLVVFKMGSRDKNGERLRSNRLAKDKSVDDTAPPASDVATIYFTVVGGNPADPDPCERPGVIFREGYIDANGDGTNDCPSPPHHVYQHPGGMQRIGNILTLATDTPLDPLPGCVIDCLRENPAGTPIEECTNRCNELLNFYEPAPDPSLILFFDVSNPEDPIFKSQYAPVDQDGAPLPNADGVAVTPLPGGRYLMAVTGGFPGDPFHFYRSTTDSLASPDLSWEYVGRVPGPNVEDTHQSLHFLREGDINGPLYLAGARGIVFFGRDRIDLYRVECQPPDPGDDRVDADCTPGDRIVLTVRFQGKPMTPVPSLEGGDKLASLAAATGFHETPSGELLFYATEHDNDGPHDTVKAGEWRHKDIVRPGSPTLLPSAVTNGPYEVNEGGSVALTGSGVPPITKAWIQPYYQDPDLGLFYPVVDYDDYALDDFDDFSAFRTSLGGFANRAQSWSWFAPVGCSVVASDLDANETRTLGGDNTTHLDPDLTSVLNDRGTDDMYQKLDAVSFSQDCQQYYATPIGLQWDLDGNGTYETAGSPVTFSATAFDGPSVIAVPVLAQHPAGGPTGQGTTTVIVHNVAPDVAPLRITNGAGQRVNVDVPFVLTGLPVIVDAGFTDPGLPDHHTATLAWGDGSADPQTAFTAFDEAFGDGTGAVTHTHRYTLAGTFPIELSVMDDDGDGDAERTAVRVDTPAQAVAEIIRLLDDLIASTTSSSVLKELQKARKALAGSVVGENRNGALAMIQAGNDKATIAFLLQQAIDRLKSAQASGANAATLIALLQQVVAALSAA